MESIIAGPLMQRHFDVLAKAQGVRGLGSAIGSQLAPVSEAQAKQWADEQAAREAKYRNAERATTVIKFAEALVLNCKVPTTDAIEAAVNFVTDCETYYATHTEA